MKICPKCLKQYDDFTDLCEDDGTPLKVFQDQTSQMLGRVLDDRWIVEQKIGAGGMGEIYRGRQLSVERKVAIKILRMAFASDEKYAVRFFREANLASQIQHPHFVTIHDYGHAAEDQIFYLVMELLEGEPLSTRLSKSILPLRDVLMICAQVCSALTAAHARSVVHRDLKPDNIYMIDVSGSDDVFVKVLDFGIAKDLDDTEQVTQTGQIFGTPEYMSPEQCQDGTRVDARSDLYSIGCIMYELLSGFSPFHRDSALQTLLAQVSTSPPSFEDLDIPVPAAVDEICWRLLEKRPENRYQSAQETKNAIDAALNSLESFELESFDASQTRLESAAFKAFPTQALRPTEPNPIGLESHLSLTVKDAIRAEAAERMFHESEETTAEIDADDLAADPDPRIKPVTPIIVLLLVAGIVGAFAWFYFNGNQNAEPAFRMANLDRGAAVSKASSAAHESGSTGAARLSARMIALKSEALASVLTPPKKMTGHPNKPISNAALLPIRTRTLIEKSVRSKQRQLSRCYALRKDKTAAGKYTFAFTIEPNGKVVDVVVGPNDFTAPGVDRCVKRKISRWKFPPGDTVDRHERTITFKTRN